MTGQDSGGRGSSDEGGKDSSDSGSGNGRGNGSGTAARGVSGPATGCAAPPLSAAVTDKDAEADAEMGTGTGTPVSRETRTGTGTDRKPFLYVVLCAAGIANDVGKLIRNAQQRTWRVGVIATPRGRECVDTAAIEALTGYPVRSAWRVPGEPRPLPPADAIAVAPATFNTINKWAQGIADTLALGILCEAHGFGTPTAALPYLNAAQAAHPAYAQSLARLRRMGVLLGDYVPHPPRTGGGRRRFRWEQALDLLAPVLERR